MNPKLKRFRQKTKRVSKEKNRADNTREIRKWRENKQRHKLTLKARSHVSGTWTTQINTEHMVSPKQHAKVVPGGL